MFSGIFFFDELEIVFVLIVFFLLFRYSDKGEDYFSVVIV